MVASSMMTWLVYIACAMLVLYVVLVLVFVAVGRRTDARALAGFVPDCVILFSRRTEHPRASGPDYREPRPGLHFARNSGA
jgi:hypothetical protein